MGNSRTPAKTASLPAVSRSTGVSVSDVTISWKLSNWERASSAVRPFTSCVISDAEAFEMAHPEPSK